ncbi:CobW family GTP-binding protein [Pararhodobacter oceanensis]|uniref:GTP-binding protein n=1 Tax=Pararhodobacter oceanensis TaxID=2172121 RepID=A0A2T8HQW7_9RHOB|nr:GTP-binding protein [Pararhodobacter oceanensis]PVH27806.1 GTP-binding protein [Pararhodobacter oceanensis]
MALEDKRVPVTLLTGFLGAGKTTLLNHLIRDPEAGRIAVIMNEFGDVALDHDLIETATEETVLLQSGCLCCAILGDLAKTLTGLQAKRDAGEVGFDRVVIETSGIADPGPIVHTLVTDHQIARAFRLDGVVTLADAATGMTTLDRQFEAVHQAAIADLLILTKTDLVDPFDLRRFETRLSKINASAKRVHAAHGKVPPGMLFGLTAMRGDVTSAHVVHWLGISTKPAAEVPEVAQVAKSDPLAGLSGILAKPSAPLGFTPSPPATNPRHDHQISSASIEVSDPIPVNIFDAWLDGLVALRGPDILRMKGILHVEGLQYPFVFHGVQHIFDAPVPLKSWTGADTTSRVVVIARGFDEAELNESLKLLLMRPETTPEPQALQGGMMADTSEYPF